jgi:large subunit ribosomal protein L17
MNHNVFGRKLSRSRNERRRLFQNLLRDLIKHGTIVTTLAKAKAVQGEMDKLITKAKGGHNSQLIAIRKILVDKKSVDQLLNDAKTRFANRNSGYTSIIKIGPRLSDSAEMVRFSFVDQKIETEVIAPKKDKIIESKKPETKESKKQVKKR